MEYIDIFLYCYSLLGELTMFVLSDLLYDNNIISGLFYGILNALQLLLLLLLCFIYFVKPHKELDIPRTEIISGKQHLLNVLKIKSNTYLRLACIPISMIIIHFLMGAYSGFVAMLLLVGVPNILYAIYFYGGEESLYVKRKHNVIELADDLLDNTIFCNEFIIISNTAIAQSNDITRIADRNDVIRYLWYSSWL